MSHEATIDAWMMTEPGKPMEKRSFPAEAPAEGEALVKVAGCGVCHTDISFLHMGVKTRAELPLVLGHEISGKVTAAGSGVDPGLDGGIVPPEPSQLTVIVAAEQGIADSNEIHARIIHFAIFPPVSKGYTYYYEAYAPICQEKNQKKWQGAD